MSAVREPAPVSSFPRRVVLRPFATPLPLGFLALMLATGSFAVVQLEWVAPGQARFAAYAALLFTAPAQALASVLGFLARDPVAGTGMGILSGTWAAFAVATLTSPPGSLSPGIGMVLIWSAIALLVPAAAAVRKPLVAAVVGLSSLRFLLTGIAMTSRDHGWLTVAGWVGLLLAVVSFYAALALELEGARRREVLPVWRGDRAGSVAADEEPGVRDEL